MRTDSAGPVVDARARVRAGMEQKIRANGAQMQPVQAPKHGVAAVKATTKRALLTGLRNGNLAKAVDKMEADEAAARPATASPKVQILQSEPKPEPKLEPWDKATLPLSELARLTSSWREAPNKDEEARGLRDDVVDDDVDAVKHVRCLPLRRLKQNVQAATCNANDTDCTSMSYQYHIVLVLRQ